MVSSIHKYMQKVCQLQIGNVTRKVGLKMLQKVGMLSGFRRKIIQITSYIPVVAIRRVLLQIFS